MQARSEHNGRSKAGRLSMGTCVALQPRLAVEFLVANDGWVASTVKAVSRRRRGPQARLYRTCHPAILGHRGRRLGNIGSAGCLKTGPQYTSHESRVNGVGSSEQEMSN